jgi:hypothetical protein
LTDGEESGGSGARAACKTLSTPPVRALIQLDRQGAHDAVFYDGKPGALLDYVAQWGFSLASGSFTDISLLAPAWELAGVNLSVGYYRQHTQAEYLSLVDCAETLRRVDAMLRCPPAAALPYEESTRWTSTHASSAAWEAYYAPRRRSRHPLPLSRRAQSERDREYLEALESAAERGDRDAAGELQEIEERYWDDLR